MKLYAVRVEWDLVMLAEDEEDAKQSAESLIKYGAFDEEADYSNADEISALSDLPSGYTADCRPWGDREESDRTIGEILSQEQGGEQ